MKHKYVVNGIYVLIYLVFVYLAFWLFFKNANIPKSGGMQLLGFLGISCCLILPMVGFYVYQNDKQKKSEENKGYQRK